VSVFDRYLSLWVALCIAAGVALGNLFPGLFQMVADWEYASVNLVVAVLIWAMVYPMMVAVDFASLRHIHKRPKGLVITLAVNWLIKPFTMAALGVLFFEYVFADLIDPADAGQYIAGLILLGAAPCTAMVFIWSQLTRGDANYTLVQVSLNDIIMIFAFAPDRGASAGRHRHRGAVADAAPVGRALCRHSAGRRGRDPRGTGEERRGRRHGPGRGPRRPLHRRRQAVLDPRAAGHRGASVRVPGACHPRPAAADRAHRGPASHPVLRHLRHRLCRGLGLAGARTMLPRPAPHRHVELLRTGGRRGHRAVRAQFRRRPRHRRRRPRRGAGDAVAGRLRQPDASHFPASEEPLEEAPAVRIQHGDAR
jgi:hypothetical protein